MVTSGEAPDFRCGLRLLGEAIRKRRRRLGLTQQGVRDAGGPAVATLRILERGDGPRPRKQTLEQLDDALKWFSGTAATIMVQAEGSGESGEFLRRVVAHEPGTTISLDIQEPGATLLMASVSIGEYMRKYPGGPSLEDKINFYSVWRGFAEILRLTHVVLDLGVKPEDVSVVLNGALNLVFNSQAFVGIRTDFTEELLIQHGVALARLKTGTLGKSDAKERLDKVISELSSELETLRATHDTPPASE